MVAFKKSFWFVMAFVCFGWPAVAAPSLVVNTLAGSQWSFTELDYSSKDARAAWHQGEITFNPDFTVEARLTDSSAPDHLQNPQFGKYFISNTGAIEISIDSKNPDPLQSKTYIYGNLTQDLSRISGVITLDTLQPGVITLLRKVVTPFSSLDLTGPWGGKTFFNDGKDFIGWVVSDFTIDAKGQMSGTSVDYKGRQGHFQGSAMISPSGDITITGQGTDDPKSSQVFTVTGKLSSHRDQISFVQSDNFSGIGTGIVLKK